MTIPKKLKGLFIEAINRTELDAMMLRQGYIPFLPVIDAGIDVIYYRGGDRHLRFVQAKGRVAISKKYLDRDICMAFSEKDHWYLYPHDDLVHFCEAEKKWVTNKSWREDGEFNSKKIPAWMSKWMQQWRIE